MTKTANAVLDQTYENNNWKMDPPGPNTTDGIQRMLKAQGEAIKALADHIDGLATPQAPSPYTSASDASLHSEARHSPKPSGEVVRPGHQPSERPARG